MKPNKEVRRHRLNQKSGKTAESITRKSIQNRLDIAAEYLERDGHFDLAAKVDYYCAQLDTCTPENLPLIKRALSRVLDDGRSRVPEVAAPADRVVKAQAATQKARRVSDKKRETIKRRLSAIAAKRKKAKNMLESFREDRKERLRIKAEKMRRTRKNTQ